MPRGDGARGSSSPLAQPVGLDEREELGTVGSEQRHDELGALREADVRLEPGDPELEVRGGHDVQEAGLEPEPVARAVLDDATRNSPEAGLDRLDGVGRRQKLVDIGLAQVERHRWIIQERG